MASFEGGKLYVKVCEARNTLACDVGGTSDPYAVLEHTSTRFVSTVVEKTLNPVWGDQEYVFDVVNFDDELEIKLMDKDLIGSDDFMGRVVVSPRELTPGLVEDKWYVIVGRKGKTDKKKKSKRGDLRLIVQLVSYRPLVELLSANDLAFTVKLCELRVQDKLARALIAVFFGLSDQTGVRLLARLIKAQVAATYQETTLFRTDSVATKCMAEFLRVVGLQYLSDVVGPIHDRLRAPTSTVSFELDPMKLGPNDDAAQNLKDLLVTVNELVDRIVGSARTSPLPIRRVCGILHDEVANVFPESALKSVGGFLVLRFMGPSITAPHKFGLCEDPVTDRRVTRNIIVVAKVLQNISNGVLFGKKEPYFSPLNDFVGESIERFRQYFQVMSSFKGTTDKDRVTLPTQVIVDQCDEILRQCDECRDKLLAASTDDEKKTTVHMLETVLPMLRRAEQQERPKSHTSNRLFRLFR